MYKIKNLEYEIKGNPNSNIAIMFLHGWPDTIRLWDK